MTTRRDYFAFARLFGSAITSQALLSATSLAIGLMLVRRTTDLQYGYFILASGALILLASLQRAFFNPALATRSARLDDAGRRALIGGLYRGQRRVAAVLCGAAGAGAAALWFLGRLDSRTGPVVLVTVAAAGAVLNREYFRMVLLERRRAWDVLRADVVQGVLLVGGVFLATLLAAPAAGAMVATGVAALVSGLYLARILRQADPWDTRGEPGILRAIAPLAAWSTAGAAIHWTFSQGYAWLVAGTLDVTAVAAIAATRLTVMPVNLLSSGIGMLMLPLVARWLHDHGPQPVLRRLLALSLALAAASVCYLAAVWLARDWIFGSLLHKQFAQRDALLALWSVIFLVTVIRDQLIHFVAARGLFRPLTWLALASATLSLTISYWTMPRVGPAGALVGLLLGELVNLGGIMILSYRESRHGFTPLHLAVPMNP
ncbi:MAG: capsular biosynthesis protein [Gammaproteobacteria bacterium]